MELYDLRYAITVAEEGSLSKAAERLYITQPTLSQALRKIEQQVGKPLFERRPYGMQLTEDGRAFMGRARQVLQLMEKLDSELQKFTDVRLKTLNIGAPITWGGFLVSRIFRQFYAAYPTINLNISEMKSSLLEAVLLKRQVDVAIVAVPDPITAPIKRLNSAFILSDPILVAVPADSPICEKLLYESSEEFPMVPMEALQGEPYITYKAGVPIHATFKHLFEDCAIQAEPIAAVSSAGTAKRLAQCGMGWTLVSRIFARYCLAPPHPVYCVPILKDPPRLNVMVLWRKDEPARGELRYLIELLRNLDFS